MQILFQTNLCFSFLHKCTYYMYDESWYYMCDKALSLYDIIHIGVRETKVFTNLLHEYHLMLITVIIQTIHCGN